MTVRKNRSPTVPPTTLPNKRKSLASHICLDQQSVAEATLGQFQDYILEVSCHVKQLRVIQLKVSTRVQREDHTEGSQGRSHRTGRVCIL